MVVSTYYELTTLAAACLTAVLSGVVYDLFRAVRACNGKASLCDALMWLSVGLICVFSWFRFLNGELRWYMIIGALCGGVLYFFLLSGPLFRVFVFFVKKFCVIFNIILKILLTPLKFLCKILSIYGKWAKYKISVKVKEENYEKKA